MSGRTAGFVFARGLAVLISLQSVYLAVTVVDWVRGATSNSPLGWPTWLFLLEPVVNVAVATALWAGASRFGPETNDLEEQPMTNQTAMGVAILGVSAFVICTHLAGFINFLWLCVRPERGVDGRPHYWADVSVVLLSAAILPYGWRLASGYGSSRANEPTEGQP